MPKNEFGFKVEDLNGSQRTLILTLLSRAMDCKSPGAILKDEKSVELADKIGYDYLRKSINTYGSDKLNWFFRGAVIRTKQFDDAIRKFISIHQNATIVNIGCGLDATFHRVDNGTIRWYDLDVPEVIELRRRLIPEGDRVTYISKSLFEFSWFDDIKGNKNECFFFANGVFSFLCEQELRSFFLHISSAFPGSEMLFDGFSRLGRIIGKKTLKGLNMSDTDVKLSITSPEMFRKWSPAIDIKDSYPFFKGVPADSRWGKKFAFYMAFNQCFKACKFVHLVFKELR